VCRPCLSAFLLPRGAPDPGAPPCIPVAANCLWLT
jgi:hypothetical protein